MSKSRRLKLILPGLLGPVTDTDAVARLRIELPALGRLLSRADTARARHDDPLASIFRAFGIDDAPAPAAAAARLGEADGAAFMHDDRWWLRADPVHLRVDTTHARLFGSRALGLQAAETEALVERLNTFYAEDGLIFEAPAPDRWYLAGNQPQDLRSYPPERVAGRNVDAFMPEGEDARTWRARLTELQMLLHDAPTNKQREHRGALPVNSVWPWGGGFRPQPASAPDRVWSEEPVARGLARLAGAQFEPRPAALEQIGWTPGTTLMVERSAEDALVHGEIEAWLEQLAAFERDLFEPLLDALRNKDLDELVIDPGDGRRLTMTRRGLRRIWRRSRPWTDWLGQEPA